ncbi:cholesterol oxidase substrate-binding domain-containing protein [Streptacidiphilus griseoplanus]|uniref:cholesterol oxidase substrate-binding domain-containing protein n=1 Tax=Peterkaempfera griseoplana TaxID=66896 RepID=UPI0006E12728
MMTASAALGGATWLLRGTLAPGSARAAEAPPGFPAGLDLYQGVYENWSGEIRTDALWTCAPRTAQDVLTLADWAHSQGWRLRPQGHRHTWTPFTVPDAAPADTRVVLVDTTAHLTGARLDGPDTVRVQAGTAMEDLLAFLGGQGRGLTSCPAPGDLTVGGALAIGGHGTAIPADGEVRAAGHGYGSLSSLVTELTAVVWDAGAGRYALRTFDRAEADCAAVLTHLGRAFVTEAVLRTGQDTNLRCVSRLDIPAAELFAPPGQAAPDRTFAGFVDATGRAEAIWFAFTDRPWLKTWSVTPHQPLGSRAVGEPYNYPFSDSLPEPVARLAGEILSGSWSLATVFGNLQYLVAKAALTGDISDVLLSGGLIRDLLDGDTLAHLLADGLRSDLWGPSRDLLLYVRPSTLRETANGYAVLTRRADLQWVVSQFAAYYQTLLQQYAARGEYPVNGQVEIRVTGVDDPAWSQVAGAQPPLLSALCPRPDRPDWDTAVWLDILTLPGTPAAPRFYRDIEQFLLSTFGTGDRSTLRVEWSKGWAYTADAAWSDPGVIGTAIPASLRATGAPGWDEAVATLDRLDPHRIFSSPLLDTLLR